jgi:hypothetical protein
MHNNTILEFVKQNYPNRGGKYCAEQLNLSRPTIFGIARKLKLKCDLSNIALKYRIKKPEKVHPQQFICPNTPEAAYILGLLWADGCISHSGTSQLIRIKMITSDLENLIPTFLNTGNWKIYHYKYKNKWKPYTIIQTNNRPLFTFLNEHGYKSKSEKSACMILSKIPKHLHTYWFRGLFDGDGCFYTNFKNLNQIYISSSYKQNWTYLENQCKNLNLNYSIKRIITKKLHKHSYLRITKSKDCLRFLNFIYNDINTDKMYLKRKYEKYLKWKMKYDNK